MKTYHTEQKKALLDFLSGNSDKQFTIEEIAEFMSGINAPAKSTLYRLMTKLVDDGHVKRFVKGNSRVFLYQYAGTEHCNMHLHLKCMQCGQLIHLEEDRSQDLQQRILAENHFIVDKSATTIFGQCENCALQNNKRESHNEK